ncbi:MAG: GTPase Era [Bacteroidales bacterium]|nr:GTPase Era [Bacteroidales bacterium]
MSHKAGFVNIIGNPNVGKSTLMNALVGEKISIITRKSQTTRHRILGVVSGEDFQIVFSDTPGILNPHYKLQQCMLNQVEGALTDADVYLVVTDLGETLKNSEILNKIKHSTTPTIVVINKVDNATQEKVIEIINRWKEILPNAEVVPCSALHKIGVERVMELVKEKLPISPAYYDKDMLTDKSMRFLVSEIIREKILLRYEKEIPYSTEVMVEEYLEGENLNKIRAVIFTERESQKRIIIGQGGNQIKKTGIEARKDIEEFTSKKCFLELFVKVKKDWRNSERDLQNFGYDQKK